MEELEQSNVKSSERHVKTSVPFLELPEDSQKGIKSSLTRDGDRHPTRDRAENVNFSSFSFIERLGRKNNWRVDTEENSDKKFITLVGPLQSPPNCPQKELRKHLSLTSNVSLKDLVSGRED